MSSEDMGPRRSGARAIAAMIADRSPIALVMPAILEPRH